MHTLTHGPTSAYTSTTHRPAPASEAGERRGRSVKSADVTFFRNDAHSIFISSLVLHICEELDLDRTPAAKLSELKEDVREN